MARFPIASLACLLLFELFSHHDCTAQTRQNDDEDAEAIVAAYLSAIGGTERLDKIESVKLTENVEGGGRAKADPFVTTYIQGSKYLCIQSEGGMYGYDGEVYWTVDGRAGEKQRISKSKDGSPYSTSRIGDPIGLPKLVAQLSDYLSSDPNSEPNGPVFSFVVNAPKEIPEEQSRNWPTKIAFSKATGLLTRLEFRNKKYFFSEYRVVDEIRVPHRRGFTAEIGDFVATFDTKIESVEFNVDFPKDVFSPPRVGDKQ